MALIICGSVMSEIIANPFIEREMTDNFVCRLYFRDRNELDVRNNRIDPFRIWEEMHYLAFDQSVVAIILNQLIYNNLERRLIRYNAETRMVLLTNEGRQWGEANCRARAL